MKIPTTTTKKTQPKSKRQMKKKKSGSNKEAFFISVFTRSRKRNFSSDRQCGVLWSERTSARADSRAYERASLPVSSFIFVDGIAATAAAAVFAVASVHFVFSLSFYDNFAEFWDSIRSYTDQKRQRQQHQYTQRSLLRFFILFLTNQTAIHINTHSHTSCIICCCRLYTLHTSQKAFKDSKENNSNQYKIIFHLWETYVHCHWSLGPMITKDERYQQQLWQRQQRWQQRQ